MEQVAEKQSMKLEQRVRLNVDHLKDILQHSKANKNTHCLIEVYPSRFRKILSDYYSLSAIEVPGALDNYAANYRDYTLSKLDGNGNTYKVVKKLTQNAGEEGWEKRGKCKNCDCGKKRYINPDTGECYYKEMVATNYVTKI